MLDNTGHKIKIGSYVSITRGYGKGKVAEITAIIKVKKEELCRIHIFGLNYVIYLSPYQLAVITKEENPEWFV